jgi:hypothetical protein
VFRDPDPVSIIQIVCRLQSFSAQILVYFFAYIQATYTQELSFL